METVRTSNSVGEDPTWRFPRRRGSELDDATIGSTEALMEKLWNERGFVVGGPGGPR